MSVNNNPNFYFTNQNATNTTHAIPTNNYQNTEVFQQNQAATDTFEKQENKEEKNGLSKGAKIALGVAGALALAGGIYLAVSGKGKNLIENIKKSAESGKIKEKLFIKEGGKVAYGATLENGKAVLEDGSNFTGRLMASTKAGKLNPLETFNHCNIEYENGLMKRSDFRNIFKTYEYDADRLLKSVTKSKGAVCLDPCATTTEFIRNKDGKIVEKIIKDANTGKITKTLNFADKIK